tara:strand:- start:1246 stop:1431 length:186 start_codon:yes stop_codon:yes gene_type:complete
MYLQKKTSFSSPGKILRLVIKLTIIVIFFFSIIFFVNKIDFPSPNKKIEKIISNENFKAVK